MKKVMEKRSLVGQMIDRLAHSLYRQHGPHKFAQLYREFILNGFRAFAIFFGILLAFSKYQDSQHHAVIAIEPSRFSVLMKSDQECWGDQAAAKCPAKATNKELWESEVHRWSPEYYQLLESDLKASFWLGLTISAADLKKAESAGATRLMLGVLFSRYEVWVDGQRIETGDYLDNDLPIAIDLSHLRMQEDRPLQVAISVTRDGKMQTIDSGWFLPTMGLFTSKGSDQQMRWVVFAGDTRFLIMFSIFFLFGLLANYAAFTDKAKEDFRAASVLAFILAGTQFIMADSIFRLLGPDMYYPILNLLLIGEFFAAIGLGLAISRSRTDLSNFINTTIPIAFLVIAFFTPKQFENGILTNWILHYLTPLGYGSAGILCLIQYLRLRKDSKKEGASLARAILLATMTLLFIGIAITFVVENGHAVAVETHWSRMLVSIPIYILINNIVSEARQRFFQVQETPVSEYHRRPNLPESVPGVVINLDIKSSEKLFRFGSQHGVGGTIVSTIMSQLWITFSSAGATILQSSGDDILVLFPDTKLKDNSALWLKTLIDAQAMLKVVTQKLADTHVELATMKTLEFRAAVCQGEVRPLWRTVGTSKIPVWVEAGSQNIFVETARYLEIEREVVSEKAFKMGSVLIASQKFKSDVDGFPELSAVPVSGTGKHGRNYSGLCVVIPSGNTSDLRLAI